MGRRRFVKFWFLAMSGLSVVEDGWEEQSCQIKFEWWEHLVCILKMIISLKFTSHCEPNDRTSLEGWTVVGDSGVNSKVAHHCSLFAYQVTFSSSWGVFCISSAVHGCSTYLQWGRQANFWKRPNFRVTIRAFHQVLLVSLHRGAEDREFKELHQATAVVHSSSCVSYIVWSRTVVHRDFCFVCNVRQETTKQLRLY